MAREQTMARAAQIRLIREAFDALPDMQDGFWSVADRLLDMNVEAERGHRRGSHSGPGFSAQLGARYFVVKHLLDGFAEPDRFSVDDIISIRNEVLYAQAYAKRFHAQLEPWAAKYVQVFAGVDYVYLMQDAA